MEAGCYLKLELSLIGINSFWQGSVTGLVILVAVLIDRAAKSRG